MAMVKSLVVDASGFVAFFNEFLVYGYGKKVATKVFWLMLVLWLFLMGVVFFGVCGKGNKVSWLL